MEENSFAQQIPGPSGPAAGSNYMDGVQYGSSSEQHGEASAQAIPPWVLPDIGGTSDRNDNGVGNWGEDGQPNPDASADPQHPAAVQQAFRGPASLVKYNNRDNMLQTSAGQASGGQSRARQFQQVKTGNREYFFEVYDEIPAWRRIFGGSRATPTTTQQRKPAQPVRSTMAVAAARFANVAAVLSLWIQGALGGMGLVTLLQMYLFNVSAWGDDAQLLLQYYSPIALAMNRVYWLFIIVALGAAVSRAAWSTLVIAPHSLTESMPIAFTQAVRDLRFRTVDYFLVALYCIVYLLNLLGTSMDEELEYAVSRNPQFYKEPITDAFKARVERWHALNAIKCIFLLVAWLLVVWAWQPLAIGKVVDAAAEAEANSEYHPETATTTAANPMFEAQASPGSSPQRSPAFNITQIDAGTSREISAITVYPSAGAGINALDTH